MAAFYLYSLLLAGITLNTECALMFLKEPKSPIYAVEGNDVDIEWFYSEVNKTTDLMAIIWRVQNKTTGNDLVLIVETVGGTPTVNPNIPAEYRNRVEIKDQATLVIKEVTSGDSTDFSCRLRSSQAAPLDAISRIQLVVIGQASAPLAQCADVGSTVTITCNAKAVPGQNFTWIRREIMETVNNGGRFSIVSTLGSSQLIVKNVSITDHGYYACDATMNLEQNNEAVVYIQVPCSDPPKQDTTYCQETSYSLAVGDTKQICCPVSGYPPPFFTWKKDGVQLKGEDSVLTITISGEKDFGNYTCTATDFRTPLKPIYIPIKEKVGGLSVKAIDGTVETPAKLEIHRLPEAKTYMVEISGQDIKDDYVIGTKTSVELHYNTMVMKTGSEKPEEIKISVHVTAMSENGCIDETPKPLKLIIKRPSDTEY